VRQVGYLQESKEVPTAAFRVLLTHALSPCKGTQSKMIHSLWHDWHLLCGPQFIFRKSGRKEHFM